MSTTIKINITSTTTNHTQGHNLDHEVMPVRKYLKTQVDNFVHQDIKLLHIGPPGPGLSYYKQMKFFYNSFNPCQVGKYQYIYCKIHVTGHYSDILNIRLYFEGQEQNYNFDYSSNKNL